MNNLLRHVLGNASMLLTVSEYTAQAARKQTDGKVPAEVLRPPLLGRRLRARRRDEAACLRERLGIDGQLVVCVGRLVPRKGQDKLIDALALLRSEFPRLHLVLIGEGRLATGLYDRAQKRGVGERVHLTGALADKAMKEWLRAADVFASPCRSRWAGLEVEGFGIVFAEAALAGLPVIAGDSGGAPEAVIQGETGLVVDGHSVPAGRRRAWRRSCAGRPSSVGRWAPRDASSPWRAIRRRSWASATANCCAGRRRDERPRAAPPASLQALRWGWPAASPPAPSRPASSSPARSPASGSSDLGDGKAGSSNVARSVGWKAGAAVLALDALKAYAPATAARLDGAGDNEVAAVGISAMCGHIAVVKGRGAASALGAAFAMDPAMMAVGCVPLVGGSLLHRHAEAVTITALSLPLISLALRRSPRRALGPLALITVLFAARLRGLAGRAAARLPRGPLEPLLCSTGTSAERGGPPVRVGLVSPYSWTVPGGVNHHVEHLAEELEERGHETWIIAPVGALTPARRQWTAAGIAMAERFIPMGTAVPVPTNGSLAYMNFSPQVVARMDRAMRYGRFDVLHVHEPGTPAVAGWPWSWRRRRWSATFHAALEASCVYDQLQVGRGCR